MYTKKFENITMNIKQLNKNLWIAQNPKLSIGYTASTYDAVVEKVEEEMGKHPENFIMKTDAEMHGMSEGEYNVFIENQKKLVEQMRS